MIAIPSYRWTFYKNKLLIYVFGNISISSKIYDHVVFAIVDAYTMPIINIIDNKTGKMTAKNLTDTITIVFS